MWLCFSPYGGLRIGGPLTHFFAFSRASAAISLGEGHMHARSLSRVNSLQTHRPCPPGSSVPGILQARIRELPFPTPGDCPDSGIKPASPVSPALVDRFFTTGYLESPDERERERERELPCPSPGALPDSGIEASSLMSPALAGGFFNTNTTWEAQVKESRFLIMKYRSTRMSLTSILLINQVTSQ